MRFPKIILVTFLSLLASGCYLMQATQGQVSLLVHRQPIAKLAADPATEAALKTKLEYVKAAREFASRELGLPDNKSYRSYVDVKRDYVLWNVFAAPEFSVNPLQWCFPVAGCVVYRGYFKETAANHYAEKLRSQGHDVVVSGVPAYSTLGHFNDPVLSTMMRWSNSQLAATVFHELAHQVVYVKNDSSFNEAFATVVADEGIKRWLQQAGKQSAWEYWQLQEQRGNVISGLLMHARQQLQELYVSHQSADQMRQQKQLILEGLKAEYATLKTAWDGYSGYDKWFDRPLKNADFISVATYQQCVPGFARLLHSVEDDLPKFYAAVKSLATQDSLTRQKLCQ